MPASGYTEGGWRALQEVSIAVETGRGIIPLYAVPDNYVMRWRFLHYILNIDTANAAFRAWFINIVSPVFGDAGQMIPGVAAVGGGGPVTNSPIHELLDATSPVFFDEVFQGAAGVQPQWDYSGLSSVWWPGGYKFQIDATQLVAPDGFQEINGLVELMPSEADPGSSGPPIADVYRGRTPFLLPQRG